MKEIRNSELKRELTAYAVIAAAFAITGFITGPFCAFLLLAAGIAFCLAHLYFARKRYREMEELAEQLSEYISAPIYNTYIRPAVAVEEAQANRADIFDYAGKSTVADDYRAFIEEFLKGVHA